MGHTFAKVNLRDFLEPVFKKYHDPRFLNSDPLEFVHRYSQTEDQEVVAVYAALLAYGNVKQIRTSLALWLEHLDRLSEGRGPGFWARQLDKNEFRIFSIGAVSGFCHRFHRGEDLVLLGRLIGKSLSDFGSLGAHFSKHFSPEDDHVGEALNRFLGDWKNWATQLDPVRAESAAFRHLLSRPQDGSCCKRWLMFLRWMVRQDGVDLGIWQRHGIRPRQLLIPLDTHTGRISQYLRLTDRKSLNWNAVLEITQRLRYADPEDPVKYDFALARLGILSICQKKYRKEVCQNCELVLGCRFAQSRSKGLR